MSSPNVRLQRRRLTWTVRSLLLLTSVVATALLWALGPHQTWRKFVRCMAAKDVEAAAALIAGGEWQVHSYRDRGSPDRPCVFLRRGDVEYVLYWLDVEQAPPDFEIKPAPGRVTMHGSQGGDMGLGGGDLAPDDRSLSQVLRRELGISATGPWYGGHGMRFIVRAGKLVPDDAR